MSRCNEFVFNFLYLTALCIPLDNSGFGFCSSFQVHLSEARVAYSLQKLADMESMVNDKLLHAGTVAESRVGTMEPSTSGSVSMDHETIQSKSRSPSKGSLNVSGPVKAFSESLRNFWYPIAFSADVNDETLVSCLMVYRKFIGWLTVDCFDIMVLSLFLGCLCTKYRYPLNASRILG